MTKLIKSFQYAINGLTIAFREERNLKIHFIVAILVVLLAIYLAVSTINLILLLIMITLVLVAEIFNTVIERVLDYIQPNYDLNIKGIKDLAAGAVLVTAIFAIIVGIAVFVPYIIK